jgi:hypothetical protein
VSRYRERARCAPAARSSARLRLVVGPRLVVAARRRASFVRYLATAGTCMMSLHKLNGYKCFYWRAADAQVSLVGASSHTATWGSIIYIQPTSKTRYLCL